MTEFCIHLLSSRPDSAGSSFIPGLAFRFPAKCLESDFWLIPRRIEAPIFAYAKFALYSLCTSFSMSQVGNVLPKKVSVALLGNCLCYEENSPHIFKETTLRP